MARKNIYDITSRQPMDAMEAADLTTVSEIFLHLCACLVPQGHGGIIDFRVFTAAV